MKTSNESRETTAKTVRDSFIEKMNTLIDEEDAKRTGDRRTYQKGLANGARWAYLKARLILEEMTEGGLK